MGLWISKHRTFKLHGVFSNTYPWSLTAQNTLLQEMYKGEFQHMKNEIWSIIMIMNIQSSTSWDEPKVP